jgi:iron complex transport system ATP-binding protein
VSRGLELAELAVGYRLSRGRRPPRVVAEAIDAAAPPGELTALLGPNGTGKSTLLRTLAGLQPALAGQILLDGTDLTRLRSRDRARKVAVVLTERVEVGLLSARELVGLGRHPHTKHSGALDDADRRIVRWALAVTRASALADRPVSELSDGERQRVLIARALAQQPALLLLDEPTAFLDAPSRVALTGLLRGLAREHNLVVVVSTHDVDLALRVADQVWLLDAHGVLRAGPPEHLVVEGHINAAFDSEDLSFDTETVGFQLRATPIGTARITAPSAAGARVLARLGWEVTTTGPTDIEVRATGTDFDVHGDGGTRRVDGLAGLAGWARTVRPGQLRRADPVRVTAALVALARFGPFFAVHLDQPDNTVLSVTDRINAAAARLGTPDRRVAASILFQGMAARLWSPVLGCLATAGIVPDLPAPTQWQLRADGGVEPCIPHPGGWIVTEDAHDVAALVERIVIRNVLQPLAAQLRAEQPIARGLLWGNVTSALVGPLRVLQRGAVDDPLTAAVVLRLLDTPPLAGTAALGASGNLDEFRRRSCCLYYRIPSGGRCGDCALDHTPEIRHRTITQPRRTAQ